MRNEIELKMNEDGFGAHDVKVNGVRMTIYQHESGQVKIMIHTEDDKLSINMCNVKVSKKTTHIDHDNGTKTIWADISITEKLGAI